MDRSMNRDPEHKRLSVSEISRMLKKFQNKVGEMGTVASGISRGQGIFRRPMLPKIDRNDIRLRMVEKVLEKSLDHPEWGPGRLDGALKADGVLVSRDFVYNVLSERNLGTEYERLLRLQYEAAKNNATISAKQMAAIEKLNRNCVEDDSRGEYPGKLLVQSSVYIGAFKNRDELFLQMVIDTYSGYAFAFLNMDKSVDAAVSILYNDVLPFFAKISLPVSAILTDNSRQFCGDAHHHFNLFLAMNNIGHQKFISKYISGNRWMRRFSDIVREEFFLPLDLRQFEGSPDVLQKKIGQWLAYYNRQRPAAHMNLEKSPHQTLLDYIHSKPVIANTLGDD